MTHITIFEMQKAKKNVISLLTMSLFTPLSYYF